MYRPKDTLAYDGGLQAAVTSVAHGPSTSILDDEGPYTIISYQLPTAAASAYPKG
ncbi:hypothetical protein [Rhodococcus sp. 077-4]|uniref:hypothetical protein n=1 Tax=Rhodococcus sp. 077-4 TaxID=2789271 RepID=UPI0039F53EDD